MTRKTNTSMLTTCLNHFQNGNVSFNEHIEKKIRTIFLFRLIFNVTPTLRRFLESDKKNSHVTPSFSREMSQLLN